MVAERPASLSLIAEVLIDRLNLLEPTIRSSVASEAARIPDRWREGLRQSLVRGDRHSRLEAAVLLDQIGEREDVLPLRRIARELRTSPGAGGLGRGLARRLADRVTVEDQGRVEIQLGNTLIPGTIVRRKVLALLCFLLSRPSMSATRDQVLDSLWPDLEPEVAANSLNQTVYFLRRVFEPAFSEETSPGYVHHDSDVLWLDPELVDSDQPGLAQQFDSPKRTHHRRTLNSSVRPIEADLLSTLPTRNGLGHIAIPCTLPTSRSSNEPYRRTPTTVRSIGPSGSPGEHWRRILRPSRSSSRFFGFIAEPEPTPQPRSNTRTMPRCYGTT